MSATNRCPEGYFGDWGSIRIVSGRTGAIIREVRGPNSVGEFGAAVCAVPDVNGDGIADVVVGAPGETLEPVPKTGSIFVLSGSSGQIIRGVTRGTGSGSAERFGASLAPVGDVSGDGVSDVVIGSPMSQNAASISSGVAFVISGANGGVIDSVAGTDLNEGFGSRLVPLGDWNGDGDIDVAISSPAFPAPGGGFGRVLLFDVAHMTSIDTLTAGSSDVVFGAALSMLGDVDGDGFADLGVGAPGVGSNETGHVYVYSRAQPTPIVSLVGNPSEQFGSALASGNFDGDGLVDLVVGAKGFTDSGGFHRGAVYFYSGYASTGQLVAAGTSTLSELGTSVATIGDINGDGRAEILIGAPGETSEENLYGAASVTGYVATVGARCFSHGDTPLQVGQSYADPRIQIEPLAGAFDLGLLRPETFSLSLAANPNQRVGSSGLLALEDSDNDGIVEASLRYPAVAVASLFDSYGSGPRMVTAVVEGDLVDGRRVVALGQLAVSIAAPIRVLVSPNPSRGEALISFRTSAEAPCGLVVFDVHGRRVGHWTSPSPLPAGFQRVDLSDVLDDRRKATNGVYYYVVTVGSVSQAGRLVIIR